ncbi:MAG: GPP34 family phosphoprotein [Draconibacterium sp.]|nr:GPP34 family phosphoprotein [Draconibacterium sp.]
MNELIPLSQKLYILGINTKKGGIVSGSAVAMNSLLSGSLIIELFRNGNIEFDNKKIIVVNSKTDNGLHRFVLDKMNQSKRQLKISRWINKLGYSAKFIRKEVQQNLVKKRVIRMQPKQFLFFKWEIPVLLNKQMVAKLIAGIEKQIFSGSATEDEIILLSFIEPGGFLRRIYTERAERKTAKKRLKKMMIENPVSEAVAEAVMASQAVAASVAVSVATSGAR